ncbi:hypothetical protein D0T12_32785 [Actinomadura spongiicola]|uniref:Uncharacterized protein n=1 Tax=Actinomadura spongiicola TaxID=2303421 RepID=A0A372G8K2_9ACTN|nr:hypothetical protein [Actinomadura spongiicola]RFS81403.1 hypothetical protein D0T12_32785 [Actinomadura spongiicola]
MEYAHITHAGDVIAQVRTTPTTKSFGKLNDPRVLVCGGRAFRRTVTVHLVLVRLHARYSSELVVIEGACTGR